MSYTDFPPSEATPPSSVVMLPTPTPTPEYPTETDTALSDTGDAVSGDQAYTPEELAIRPWAYDQPVKPGYGFSDVEYALLGAGYELVANLRSLGQHLATSPENKDAFAAQAENARQWAKYYADIASPESKAARAAPLFSMQTLLNLPLYVADMTPETALVLAPGGVVRGIVGTALTMGVGATVSGAAETNRMYEKFDELSTDEFVRQSKAAQDLVAKGMDPEQARKQVTEQLIGYKPWFSAVIGGLAWGVTGGQAAGHIPGFLEKGLAKRVAVNTGIDASVFGAQGATNAATLNQAIDQSGLLLGKADIGSEMMTSAELGALLSLPFTPRARKGAAPGERTVTQVGEVTTPETELALEAAKPNAGIAKPAAGPPAAAPGAPPAAGAPRSREVIQNAIDVAEATGQDTAPLRQELAALGPETPAATAPPAAAPGAGPPTAAPPAGPPAATAPPAAAPPAAAGPAAKPYVFGSKTAAPFRTPPQSTDELWRPLPDLQKAIADARANGQDTTKLEQMLADRSDPYIEQPMDTSGFRVTEAPPENPASLQYQPGFYVVDADHNRGTFTNPRGPLANDRGLLQPNDWEEAAAAGHPLGHGTPGTRILQFDGTVWKDFKNEEFRMEAPASQVASAGPVTPESNVPPAAARAKSTGRRRTAKKKAAPAAEVSPPLSVGAAAPETVGRRVGEVPEAAVQLGETIEKVTDTARAGTTANAISQPDQGPTIRGRPRVEVAGGPGRAPERAAGKAEPASETSAGGPVTAGGKAKKAAVGPKGVAAKTAVKTTAQKRAEANQVFNATVKQGLREALAPEKPAATAGGAKGESIKTTAAARESRVLPDVTAKPVDQNAVVSKNIKQGTAKTEKAEHREKVGEDKAAGIAQPTKKSKASQAKEVARVRALSKLFTDNGPRTNWTVPDHPAGTAPEKVVGDWNRWLDRVLKLADQIRPLEPKKAIHGPTSDADLFGREVLDLAETAAKLKSESMDKRQTDAANLHIKTFVSRINSIKVREDGTFDTKSWREDRVTEGAANRRGGTPRTEAVEQLTEALPEAATRSTGAKAPDEKPAVGKTRKIDLSTEEGQRIAAAALARSGPAKLGKIPGKTEGKTTPVTSESNKIHPKAEAAKEVSHKRAAPQSTKGLDDKYVGTVTRVEGLRQQLKDTKIGTAKHAEIADQLEKATRAEAAATAQVNRRLLTREEGRPSEDEVAYAEREAEVQRTRIAKLKAAGKDNTSDDLVTAQRKLDRAQEVLDRAEAFDGLITKEMPAGARTADGWADQGGETPDAVRSIVRRYQHTHRAPAAKIANTIPLPDGSEIPFKSIVNSTVGALTKNLNVEVLANRIFGFNSPAGDAVIKRILDVTKNIPVYFLNQDRDIPHLGLTPFIGAHTTAGDNKGRLFFDVRSIAELSEERYQEVLLHESTHGFVTQHLNNDPQFAALVDDLMHYTIDQVGYGEHARHYGLRKADPDEFIAEAFGNPTFVRLLQEIPAPPTFIKRLGLDKLRDWSPSVFDALIGAITRLFPGHRPTVFDAVLRLVGDQTRRDVEPPLRIRGKKGGLQPQLLPSAGEHMRSARDWVERAVDHAINSHAPEDQAGKIRMIKLATGDYIARMSDKYFGPGEANPVRRLVEGFERTRVDSARELEAALPLVKRMYDAERTHGPEQWGEFIDLAHDATNAGVFPDRPVDKQGFSKDGMGDVQAKARYPALAAKFAAMPEDLKTLYQDVYKFFSTQQNKLNLATIRNRLLQAAEIPLDADGEALANRIFLNKMTEADMARLGDLAKPLADTNVLGKVKGPYFPLMRRGDHVVVGRYKVAAPDAATRATKVANPEGNLIYEFGAGNVNKAKARREAMAYAAKLPQDARVQSVWVDRKTGELYSESEQGPVKVMMNDVHSDHRWRVNVQDRHVEFAQGQRNAERRAAELRASPVMESVDPVQETARQNFRGGGYLASQLRTLQASLEKRPGYAALPDAIKSQMRQVIREGSIRLLASTRIETRTLPRRHVAGAGREVVKDLLDYARASGGRIGQLRHAQQVDAALKELDRVAGDSHPQSLGRSQIANEMRDRAMANNGYNEGAKLTRAVQRFMGLSFTTDLASPSYSIVNMTQVPMLSYPALAGRYGPIPAFIALRRAYRDVGVTGQLWKGLKDTGRATFAKDINYDYLTQLRDKLPETERAVIDRAIDVGTLDPEVGLEIARPVDRYHAATPMGELAAKGGAMLDWAQTVARQLPRATEVINRSTVLLAAYRLERARGATHEAALEKAIDTVNQTQFHYAASNRAPIFNKPWVRLFMQFKQYPMGVMQMIGENLSKAWYNVEKGDRAEAVKTLAYMVGSHVAMAGVLGLPTEPFKILVIAMGAAGVPISWSDVEDFERRTAARMFGEFGGRLISKGVPAALGVDFSSRSGANNWFTFSEPDSHDAKDTFLWTAEQVMGAPGGLFMKQLRGLRYLAAGDYEQAAENIIPLKGLASMMQAARIGREGKVNVHGRQTMDQYSLPEQIIRGLGFTPTREAEQGTVRSLFHRQTGGYQSDRQNILDQWYNAPASQRGRMWGDVERFNREHTPDEKVTRAELDRYVKKRSQEETLGGEVMRGPGDAERMTPLLHIYGE